LGKSIYIDKHYHRNIFKFVIMAKSVKIYYEKYGCSLNQAETLELVQSMLEKNNELVNSPENADLIIIGTCIVIKHTENYMIRRINELSRLNKKILVYGCLPAVKPNLIKAKDFLYITPKSFNNEINIQNVPLIENTITIPIAQGCTGHCTYCISKLARGSIKSQGPEKIMEKFKDALKKGYKEIRLSALDTAAYGLDIKTNLAELLNYLTSVEGEYRIRVGMMEPSNTIKILPELIDSFRSEKVFKFFHIPFQSADDKILESMGREYSSSDFKYIANKIKSNFDHYTFSTDVIVGFPGENEESFSKTVSMVNEIRPDILNITRYSPREGTVAFRLKPVKSKTAKEWSLKLTEIHRLISFERNKELQGSLKKILVTEKGKTDFLARTDGYRPVIVKNVNLNEFYIAKINSFSTFYLYGEIIQNV